MERGREEEREEGEGGEEREVEGEGKERRGEGGKEMYFIRDSIIFLLSASILIITFFRPCILSAHPSSSTPPRSCEGIQTICIMGFCYESPLSFRHLRGGRIEF